MLKVLEKPPRIGHIPLAHLWQVSGEGRRGEEHAWHKAQVWQVEMLETPSTYSGSPHPLTYCPSPNTQELKPTAPRLPSSPEKRGGDGVPKVTGPWGPHCTKMAILPQRWQYSLHPLAFWTSHSKLPRWGSQRTFDLPQSNPNSTFRTSLERCQEEATENRHNFSIQTRQGATQTSSEVSSKLHKPLGCALPTAQHTPASYLLPKCSQKPRFCRSVLKATHTPPRFSREGGL